MASLLKFSFFFFLLIQASLLLSSMVNSKEADEDDVLQGINSYRRSHGLPNLIMHEKAECLAGEIAEDIENTACESPINGADISPTSQTQLPHLPRNLEKCKIDPTTTADGMIMPVCVPKAVSTLVLTNYTSSQRFARHLNNSRFTGAGVGSEKDWTVLVLATSTQTGSFANAAAGALISGFGFVHHLLVSLLLGLSLILAT